MDGSGKKLRSTGRTSSVIRPARGAQAAERVPRSEALGDGSVATAGSHVEEDPLFKFAVGANHVVAEHKIVSSSTLAGSESHTASAIAIAHDKAHLDVDLKISELDSKPASKRKFRNELMHSSSARASDDGRDGGGFVPLISKKIKSSGAASTFTTTSRTTAATTFSTEPEKTVGKMSSAAVAADAEFEGISKRNFASPEADIDRLRGPVGFVEAFASPVDAMTHDKIGVDCDSGFPDSVRSCVIDASSVSEVPGEVTQEMIEPCAVFSMGNDATMELPKGRNSYSSRDTEPRMSESVSLQSPTNCDEQEVYDLLFKTRDPLGFFCATSMGGNGSICYIRSVSPRVKDVRLHSGTIIVATAMGKAGTNSIVWHTVGSHEDLKKNYESYRRHSQGKWMQIRFINNKMTHESRLVCPDDWTPTSAWKGDPTWEGWAGGAPEAHNVATKDATTPLIFGKQGRRAAPPTSSFRTAPASKPKENHEAVLGNVVAGMQDIDSPDHIARFQAAATPRVQKKSRCLLPVHRGKVAVDKQPKPILKTQKALATQSKAVSFQLDPEHNSVLDSTAGGVMLTSVSTNTSTKPKDDDAVFNSLPSNSDLLLAISHQSCLEVLKLLQAGANPRPKNVIREFKPNDVAKGIKDVMDREVKRNPSPELETKCMDVALKMTMLRIFHTVRTTMIACSFLWDWVGYEMRILNVENLQLMGNVPVSKGDKFCCQIKIQGKDVCSFEAGLADWSKIKQKKGCYFFNECLPDHWEGSDDTILITFTRTYGRDQRTIVLARQKVHLNAFESRSELKVPMPKTKDLESGYVHIMLRKLGSTTRAHIDKHQRYCCKSLNGIINDVKQFNKDQSRKAMEIPELDFNFQLLGAPCSTLLHCAVHLNDSSLVAQLIECGADANLQNVGGLSPKQLALDMKQRSFNSKTCKEEDLVAFQKIIHLLDLKIGNCVELPCAEPSDEAAKDDLDIDIQEDITVGDQKKNSKLHSEEAASVSNEGDPSSAQFITTVGVGESNMCGIRTERSGHAACLGDEQVFDFGGKNVSKSTNQNRGTRNEKSIISIHGLL